MDMIKIRNSSLKKTFQMKGGLKEKELFKAFLILLPISLYLLTVILDIAGLQAVDLSNSQTALGWFIEILFVYLATFLTSFQLLKSSKISLNGNFIGEQVQAKFFSSLTQVGTPIAILSVILFIAQNIKTPQTLILIIFFSAYFFMATFIFIVFYAIFEPISNLIFIKLLNWWKTTKNQYKAKNIPMVLAYSAIGVFVIFIGYVIYNFISTYLISLVPDGPNFITDMQINQIPTFEMEMLTESLSILNGFLDIGIVLISAYFLVLIIRNNRNLFINFLLMSGMYVFATILIDYFFQIGLTVPLQLEINHLWEMGSPVLIQGLFAFNFLSMRIAFLQANFDFSTNPILFILALPFTETQPFLTWFSWGVFIYYINKEIYIHTEIKEKKIVEQITSIVVKPRFRMKILKIGMTISLRFKKI